MKNSFIIYSILVVAASFLLLNFQNQPTRQTQLTTNEILPYFEKETKGWFKIKDNIQISAQSLLEKHHADFGLTEWDEWQLYRSDEDNLGFTHHRYQQYHRGILVEGAELLVHEKDGVVQTFNGIIETNLNLNDSPAFLEPSAIDIGLNYLPAEKYIWEDEGAERMLQRIEKNPAATFYPNPELVWLKLESGNHRLAYKMDIQAEIPLFRQMIYVDAMTEAILLDVEMIHTANVLGVAETKYSGTRPMMTDSIAPNEYNLRETTRGYGVETYNLMGSREFGDAVDFVDDDNVWNNINDEQDEVATDAHWGAQVTFDYLETVHNYIGVDGDSMALISYVHYDENVVNAFWNGRWASFGDGDGTRSPLTSLDVVAHEFAHGITNANARLIYLNESGALNESFSDIFGTAVEFWATPEAGDWLIGEDFHISGGQFRDMSDPKAEGHPDTYFGANWVTGTQDNGGVHSNSGVQNFWYYLLSEGGTGTNDNGQTYEVEGLGLDTAAIIAFRNLQFYLTRFSIHADAREGGLQAAEDLYGPCSHEFTQTGNAWYAVGLGNGFQENDVRLIEIFEEGGQTCGLADSIFPTINFRYNSCIAPLDAGTIIPISLQVDGGEIVQDTLILNAPMAIADTIFHTFTKPAIGLETAGNHTLRVWTALDNDPFGRNDTLAVNFFNIIEQNSDFSGRNSPTPTPSCFMETKTISVNFRFLGCDSIAAGTEVPIYYSINQGDTIMEMVTLENTLYTFDEDNYTFETPADFTNELGRNELSAWVEFPADFLNENDETPIRFITNPELMIDEDLLTFEYGNVSLDSIYFFPNEDASIFLSPEAAANDTVGVLMTGGNVLAIYNDTLAFTVPEDSNVWEINHRFNAQSCICVNAIDMDMVSMSFDLKQTMSPLHLVETGAFQPYASPLRVLANQEVVSETFVPTTLFNDPFVNYVINLDAWAGTSFEVCFETRNLTSKEFDTLERGDNAYIDNVKIGQQLVATSEVNSQFKGLKVFPNPNNGAFSMTWGSEFSGNLEVAIFDIYGKKIKTMATKNQIGQNQLEVNLNVTAGTYFIEMTDGKAGVVEKIVVY